MMIVAVYGVIVDYHHDMCASTYHPVHVIH